MSTTHWFWLSIGQHHCLPFTRTERERERETMCVRKREWVEGSLAHIKGEEEGATDEFVRGKPL
jgi:hypothetical protein